METYWDMDALSVGLAAFHEEVRRHAAEKKQRQQDHLEQRQDALTSKRLRGNTPLFPALLQDAMNLVIEAAAPSTFEIKVLFYFSSTNKVPFSLIDGSKAGQVSVLQRLVNLASINKECHQEVLRVVGMKMKLVVNIWEATYDMPKFEKTLDKTLFLGRWEQPNNILAHAATIEIQDRLLVDFRQSHRQAIAGQPGFAQTGPGGALRVHPDYIQLDDDQNFQNRHFRRYTATFSRKATTGPAVYILSDFEYHRWSQSHDLRLLTPRLQSLVTQTHARRGKTFQPKTASDEIVESVKQGTLKQLLEVAVQAWPWQNHLDRGSADLTQVLLANRMFTEQLMESAAQGWWEEYEFEKETYAGED